jgi:hypothetical protein
VNDYFGTHDFRRTGIAISVNSFGPHLLVTDRTLPVLTAPQRDDVTFTDAATGRKLTVFVIFDDRVEDSGWLVPQPDGCVLCGNTGRITVREGVLPRDKHDAPILPVLDWLAAYGRGEHVELPTDEAADVSLPCPLCAHPAYRDYMNDEAERAW